MITCSRRILIWTLNQSVYQTALASVSTGHLLKKQMLNRCWGELQCMTPAVAKQPWKIHLKCGTPQLKVVVFLSAEKHDEHSALSGGCKRVLERKYWEIDASAVKRASLWAHYLTALLYKWVLQQGDDLSALCYVWNISPYTLIHYFYHWGVSLTIQSGRAKNDRFSQE